MITKEELLRLYVDERKSTITIGELLGCNHVTILDWLKNYGIKTRTLSEASPKTRPWMVGLKCHEGHHHTQEVKNKLRQFRTGKQLPQSTINKMIAYRSTEEYKQKQRQAQTIIVERWNDQEYRAKQIPILSAITREHWKNPEYRNKVTKAVMSASRIIPNKPELLLKSLLDNTYPNNYEYVGDGKIVIGGRCPDFINIETKKIILLHGVYWHLEKKQKLNPDLTRDKVVMLDSCYYLKYGYSTLIIWDDELEDLDGVNHRIDLFHRSLIEAGSASGVLPTIGGDT